MEEYSGESTSLVPIDLLVVGLLGLFTVAIGTGLLESLPGQSVLGLFAVLFAPGYAFVAALFPRQNSDSTLFEAIQPEMSADGGTVTVVERLVLAVGLSVCVVPLLGIGLSYRPQGFDGSTLLVVTGALTLFFTGIGVARRQQTLPRERFDPNARRFVGNSVQAFNTARDRSPITIFIVIGLVVAAGGIGLAVLDAEQGEQFTSLYLLSEDNETGETVADNYPEEIAVGQSESLTVGITNNEGERVQYNVVVQLQSLGPGGNIQEVQTLDTFRQTVAPGETWEQPHEISPLLTGEDLRVTYLVTTGGPRENTLYRPADAYRSAHFWIDVPSSTAGDQPTGQFDEPEIGNQTDEPEIGNQTDEPEIGNQTDEPGIGNQTDEPEIGNQTGSDNQSATNQSSS
jgi:uncharacterized membrane protein